MKTQVNHTHDEFLDHLRQEMVMARASSRTKRVHQLKAEKSRLKNSAMYQQLSELMKSEAFQALAVYFEPLMHRLPTASKHKPVPMDDALLAHYLAFCVLSLEARRKTAKLDEAFFLPVQDIYQCLSLILSEQKAAQNRR